MGKRSCYVTAGIQSKMKVVKILVVPETNIMYAIEAIFEEVSVMKTFASSTKTIFEKTKNLHLSRQKKLVPTSYTITSQKSEVTVPTVAQSNVNYMYYDPEIHWCQVSRNIYITQNIRNNWQNVIYHP